MRTRFEHEIQEKSQRLASLRQRAAELERELAHARVSLERVRARSAEAAPVWGQPRLRGQPEPFDRPEPSGLSEPRPPREWWAGDDVALDSESPAESVVADAPGRPPMGGPPDGPPMDDGDPGPSDDFQSAQGRTERLLRQGRLTAYRPGASRKRRIAIAAVALALLTMVLAVLFRGGGGSWPASVATVQREAATACRNPNVKSEPGQVDFACTPGTRQILWVFALMTSGGNPRFADPRSGRLGLEPISPAQGGALAWSLNLHHPYNPFNAVDSLAVAARAINNIVGGATVAGSEGKPVVEPGLESVPANCARYTGSAALTVRQGFPELCAKRLTAAGRAALVADIYQRWIVGAPPQDARDAAVLFQNAANPGSPKVQAILAQLPVSHL